MSRAIWKGAISFGLVHIPVALHAAVSSHDLDFDWLDDRSMDPVGYRRVNKVTGKEVDKAHIVRGFQYRKGQYVVVSDQEVRAANVKATQTIDLVAFVDAADISFLLLETPYYLAPADRGQKVYSLLREALSRTGKIGIATLVIHTKQHLAAVIASDKMLVLNLLRWSNEIRPVDELDLPGGKAGAAGLKPAELAMAERLIKESTVKWNPDDYRDTFQEQLRGLIERKVASGKVEAVEAPEEQPATRSADIVDLTELLKRSLEHRGTRADSPGRRQGQRAGSPAPKNVTSISRAKAPTRRKRA